MKPPSFRKTGMMVSLPTQLVKNPVFTNIIPNTSHLILIYSSAFYHYLRIPNVTKPRTLVSSAPPPSSARGCSAQNPFSLPERKQENKIAPRCTRSS